VVRHPGTGASAGSLIGLKYARNPVFPLGFRSAGSSATPNSCRVVSGLIMGMGSVQGTWLQHQASRWGAEPQRHQQIGALFCRKWSIEMKPAVRELSGLRALRRGVEIVSKPRIWSRGASAVSLETQSTFQTTGNGKDGNFTYSNLTTCWCHFDA